jgi:hypothetical protein
MPDALSVGLEVSRPAQLTSPLSDLSKTSPFHSRSRTRHRAPCRLFFTGGEDSAAGRPVGDHNPLSTGGNPSIHLSQRRRRRPGPRAVVDRSGRCVKNGGRLTKYDGLSETRPVTTTYRNGCRLAGSTHSTVNLANSYDLRRTRFLSIFPSAILFS